MTAGDKAIQILDGGMGRELKKLARLLDNQNGLHWR